MVAVVGLVIVSLAVLILGLVWVGTGALLLATLSLIELHNNLVDLASTSGGHTSCRNLMGHTPWRLSAERTITMPPTSSPTCQRERPEIVVVVGKFINHISISAPN